MSMWNFDSSALEDLQSPLEIVNSQCKELSKISGERVIARVTEYDGPYRSNELFLQTQMLAESFSKATKFDVQDVMGDNATDEDYNNRFVYELFVTSKNTPKYRYRVFIMYYSIGMYPVGLTIQEDIAKEIGFNSEGMEFEDAASFTEALSKILGSNALGKVLKNLASLNPFEF